MANANNQMVMQTLEHFGYSKEEINAVFDGVDDSLSLLNARFLLEERKKQKLGMNSFKRDLPKHSHMFILSSDEEDYSENEKNFKAPLKNQDYYRKKFPSSSDSDEEFPKDNKNCNSLVKMRDMNRFEKPMWSPTKAYTEPRSTPNDDDSLSLKKKKHVPTETQNNFETSTKNEGANILKHFVNEKRYDVEMHDYKDAFHCAYYDLPQDRSLKEWFTSNYRMKDDQVVMKDDMFSDFCYHFNIPSYPELRKLFFEKLQVIIFNIEYREVECLEDACFDGLEKIEPFAPLKISDKLQDMLKLNTKENSNAIPSPAKTNVSLERPVAKPRTFKGIVQPSTSNMTEKELSFTPTEDSVEITAKANDFSMNSKIQDLFGYSKNTNVSLGVPDSSAVVTIKAEKAFNAGQKKSDTNVSNAFAGKHAPTNAFFEKSKAVTHKQTVNHKSYQIDNKKVNYNKDDINIRQLTQNGANTSLGSPKRDKTSHLTNLELLDVSHVSDKSNLRPIIIDGSNVACTHGSAFKPKAYSCRGIALCVRYFLRRGHKDLTCFVPNFRKGRTGHPPTIGQEVLYALEERNICKFTPSRKIDGVNIVSYDDRFILALAEENGGIIVSNDQYRDLMNENLRWKQVVVNRLLQYLFVQDFFMPAEDPLGQNGPTLDEFLKFSNEGKAFGYVEPSRAAHQENWHHGERIEAVPLVVQLPEKVTHSSKANPPYLSRDRRKHKHLNKTDTDESLVKNKLKDLFPEKETEIDLLTKKYPFIDDIDFLANMLFNNDH